MQSSPFCWLQRLHLIDAPEHTTLHSAELSWRGLFPVWLAVLTAINLQTSFLHPPFGFALFFMRSVAPKSISTGDIYWGAVPFIFVQLIVLALVWVQPVIVTAIPAAWNGGSTAAAPAAPPRSR